MPLRAIQKDSVALLVPCGGPVDPRVFQSTLNLVATAMHHGIVVRQIGVTDRTLVHTARNKLSQGFLMTDCEWAMWVDADMILEPRTVPVLLQWAKKLDAKMLTGIYYQRHGDHKPIIWNKVVKSSDGKIAHTDADEYCHFFVYPGAVGGQPYKVDVAGFGCSLIHRSVFDTMKYPYFKFVFYEGEDGKPREASEDFYFYVQAKKLGFDLWAVPELNCGHMADARIITHKDMSIKRSELTEMDMSGLLAPEPAAMVAANGGEKCLLK